MSNLLMIMVAMSALLVMSLVLLMSLMPVMGVVISELLPPVLRAVYMSSVLLQKCR